MLLFVGILLRDINRSTRYRRALERANRDNEALLAAREKDVYKRQPRLPGRA